MSTMVSEVTLEKKLMSVSNTQDSIQTLSLWLLHHKANHQKIVNTWLKVLKKDKVSHRLTLFYLANDVIQNCKRKNVSYFKDSFAEVLKEATLLVRDEQIRRSVDRVFKIWEDRNVYDSDFIADLQGILTNAKVPPTPSSKLLAEFKSKKVIEKIRTVKKLEMETATKTMTVNLSKLNATNAEMVQKLKDRTHGQQFNREFEENTRCLEELVKSLTKEIDQRNELLTLLENGELYYDNQRGEAKIVANAYKNFGGRVKSLQKKLEELMTTFPSPVPSPCPDAPSPTNSDVEAELNLPGDEKRENDSDHEVSASSSISSTSKVIASSVGNPIPTVSNIFSQEPGSMTSWLDTFTKKSNSPAPPPTTTNSSNTKDTSSLDSRLSNLLQNIPNLPSGLQNTLFGTSLAESSAADSIVNSPVSVRKGGHGNNFTSAAEGQIPVKEEYSGQNTPLQDEDTPSTGTTFFTRLAAAPKASQSPKEILQGLKEFIQNASSLSSEKAHSLHDNSLSWASDKSEPIEKSDISNKAVSNFSDISRNFSPSSSPVFSSSQHNRVPSTTAATSNAVNSTSAQITANSSKTTFSDSLSHTPMSSETSISPSILQNLSFIPTLVPSIPTGSSFKFSAEDSFAAYSPEDETFDTDMDLDSGEEDSRIVTSVEPADISDSKSEDNMNVSRQSTLITLVTDNGPTDLVDQKNDTLGSFPKSDRYMSSVQSTYPMLEGDWPVSSCEPEPVLPPMALPTTKESVTIPTSCDDQDILTEAYFLSSPPQSTENDFQKEQRHVEMDSNREENPPPLSQIETVQSHRTLDEDDWERNDWNNAEFDKRRHFASEPYGRRPMDYHDYQHKRQFSGPRVRFPPRNNNNNNWHHQQQFRPRNMSNYDQGPKRFHPFSPRGRGWHRPPRPQY